MGYKPPHPPVEPNPYVEEGWPPLPLMKSKPIEELPDMGMGEWKPRERSKLLLIAIVAAAATVAGLILIAGSSGCIEAKALTQLRSDIRNDVKAEIRTEVRASAEITGAELTGVKAGVDSIQANDVKMTTALATYYKEVKKTNTAGGNIFQGEGVITWILAVGLILILLVIVVACCLALYQFLHRFKPLCRLKYHLRGTGDGPTKPKSVE